MIPPVSRYVQGTLTRVPNSSGTYNLTVFRTVQPSQTSYRLYVWQVDDRPDLVAWRFFQNPQLWWAIFDMNPELIYPLGIPPGTVVRIPRQPVMGQGTTLQ